MALAINSAPPHRSNNRHRAPPIVPPEPGFWLFAHQRELTRRQQPSACAAPQHHRRHPSSSHITLQLDSTFHRITSAHSAPQLDPWRDRATTTTAHFYQHPNTRVSGNLRLMGLNQGCWFRRLPVPKTLRDETLLRQYWIHWLGILHRRHHPALSLRSLGKTSKGGHPPVFFYFFPCITTKGEHFCSILFFE